MRTGRLSIGFGLLLSVSFTVSTHAADTIPVTVENFVRAETDLYFSNSVNGGGFDGWHHI
jgi:hypothetical protein